MNNEKMSVFTCVIGMDNMSDVEMDRIASAIKAENGLDVQDGHFEAIYGEGDVSLIYSDDFVCELSCPCTEDVPAACLRLMKSLGITKDFWVATRSFDHSTWGDYEFRDGALVKSEFRRCCDDIDFLNFVMVAKNIQLDDAFAKNLNITHEEVSVFETLAKPEILSLTYWGGFQTFAKVFRIIKPTSVQDLRVFFALVCDKANSYKVIEAAAHEYVCRREGRVAVPLNLPDSLKETYGMYLFETQKDDAEKLGVLPFSSSPCIYLAAKISAFSLYVFAYLCEKYQIHKEIASGKI